MTATSRTSVGERPARVRTVVKHTNRECEVELRLRQGQVEQVGLNDRDLGQISAERGGLLDGRAQVHPYDARSMPAEQPGVASAAAPGIEAALAPRYPDRESREAEIRRQAVDWARAWDANSLVILRRGTIGYDTVKDFSKIRAKVLYVLCRTDRLFPPSIAPGVMQALASAGVDARYFEIDSDLGHSASGPEHTKWSPVLREFLAPLTATVN